MTLIAKEAKQKCIRSMRVARELMSRGFLPMDVETSRKSKGYLVFVFRETTDLLETIDEIMGGQIK